MKVCRTASELTRALARLKKKNNTLAFVPTMGHIHAGHLALVRAGNQLAHHTIASIYVNPLQFGANEDFAQYPRNFSRDRALLAKAGAAVLFCPSARTVYPRGIARARKVSAGRLGRILEGRARPTHFDGVLSVLARLFHLCPTDYAIFGAKDFQQQFLVRRFAAEAFPDLQIVTRPTVRTRSGLALSSRNAYLTRAQTRQAQALPQALARLVAALQAKPALLSRRAMLETQAKAALRAAGLRPDYVSVRDAHSLAPARPTGAKNLVALGAVRLDTTRLLDNISFSLGEKNRTRPMRQTMLKAKLHQARATHCELEYEGSCAIDTALLQAAGMQEYEQIQIYNLANGERLTTYAIAATAGSGIISLNGAAAHKANVGDRLIICAYAEYDEAELAAYHPTLVYLDENNRVRDKATQIPEQAA